MGFKRDKFVVKLKPKFENVTFPEILKNIPNKFHDIFSILWNHFQDLSEIIDNNNIDVVIHLLEDKQTSKTVNLEKYFGLYRSTDCLQQEIRKKFFDTVIIIENVYSPHKNNIIQVLKKDQIINILVEEPTKKDHVGITPAISDSELDRTIAKVYVENLISEKTWASEVPIELQYLKSKIVNMKENVFDPIQNPI